MSTHDGTRWHGREVVIVEAARTPIGRGHHAKAWYRARSIFASKAAQPTNTAESTPRCASLVAELLQHFHHDRIERPEGAYSFERVLI
jgi:hypothetical protein